MSPDQSSKEDPPAEKPSAARLFATLSGAVLVIGGTAGFFHNSEFGTPGEIEDALGFAVNGWINTLHIVVGAIGLFAAAFAARAYSLGAAILFGAMAIWGFAAGSDDALLDRFPADEAENILHAALALLGLAAWVSERPKRRPKAKRKRARSAGEDRPRRSEGDDDSASRGDEPQRRRARRSQRRRRPPRPPA